MKLVHAMLKSTLLSVAFAVSFAAALLPLPLQAYQDSGAAAKPISPGYDAALATQTGADDYGMRKYVLVILKTGPKPVPAGPERDEMFKGHFANMNRLAEQGVLAVAGPLDGVDGERALREQVRRRVGLRVVHFLYSAARIGLITAYTCG